MKTLSTRFVVHLSFFLFMSIGTIIMACPTPTNSSSSNTTNTRSNITTNVTEVVVENPINCTSTIIEDAQSAPDKFPGIGNSLLLSASTLAVDSTLLPGGNSHLKWRTPKYKGIAILIWGSFEQASGDYLQLNRRLFYGVSRCTPYVTTFRFKDDKSRTVLIGLMNNSGNASVKFAVMSLNIQFMKAMEKMLYCKAALEYVGTSEEKLKWFKHIVTSDAARFTMLANTIHETNVYICNIFQRYKAHCGGFYAGQPCADE